MDYNGHMSEAFYVLVFGYTTDALLDRIGLDTEGRERENVSIYTVEGHISYIEEVPKRQYSLLHSLNCECRFCLRHRHLYNIDC